MKVRISYTVEVDDEFRKALRAYHNKSGMATRDEIKKWYEERGDSDNEDMLCEYNWESPWNKEEEDE